MITIPAIDLINGQCVRLKQGDYNRQTTYSQNPLQMAQLFEQLGYEWLHIIDLDGALIGAVQNQQVIVKIADQTGLKLQVGGGIRSLEQIDCILALGVDRVILGTAAVKDEQLLEAAIKKYGPERIAVAVDLKNGKVRISGWTESSPLTAAQLSKRLAELGVKMILCTDISRDGLNKGINVGLYKGLIQDFPQLEWIAAGGIRTPQGRQQLKAVGVSAAVMGSIFYEGSLLAKRIIPCLDIDNGRTVKGIQFQDLRDAGDPIELAKKYCTQGADELAFLDITATNDKRKTVTELASKISREINIPFTIGGGIRSIADIQAVLAAGADKVSIGSAIVANPDLINQANEKFGAQCLVASIDAKRIGASWQATVNGGRELTALDAISWAQAVEQRGAGEILLNSVDYDGTKQGFDLELLKAVAAKVSIPIIASGGASCAQDFVELFQSGVADAGLAASIFHFNELAIPDLKTVLAKNNLTTRT